MIIVMKEEANEKEIAGIVQTLQMQGEKAYICKLNGKVLVITNGNGNN